MKKKLTEMEANELVAYCKRYEDRQRRYQQGSKNWMKCQRRINRATLMLRTINN